MRPLVLNLLALLIGCCVAAVLVLAAESIFGRLNSKRPIKNPSKFQASQVEAESSGQFAVPTTLAHQQKFEHPPSSASAFPFPHQTIYQVGSCCEYKNYAQAPLRGLHLARAERLNGEVLYY